MQTEGASFEFGSSYIYKDSLFKEWMKPLEAYMKNSVLLLSTQDGEIRTEQKSEYDQNNYEALKDRKDWWSIE